MLMIRDMGKKNPVWLSDSGWWAYIIHYIAIFSHIF